MLKRESGARRILRTAYPMRPSMFSRSIYVSHAAQYNALNKASPRSWAYTQGCYDFAIQDELHTSDVKTLDDFTPAEIAALERQYNCKVKGKS